MNAWIPSLNLQWTDAYNRETHPVESMQSCTTVQRPYTLFRFLSSNFIPYPVTLLTEVSSLAYDPASKVALYLHQEGCFYQHWFVCLLLTLLKKLLTDFDEFSKTCSVIFLRPH